MRKKNKIKILILGGSGFIGSHVAEYLSSNPNYKITIADIQNSPFFGGRFIKCNVLTPNEVDKVMKNQDYVYNFSGQADIADSIKNPEKTIKVNILGMTNILNSCVKHKIKRVIQASTVYVNSDSGGIYKTTKLACESLLKDFKSLYNLNYTILRFGSIYGPRANYFNFISNAIDQALKSGKIIRAGKGEEIREYVHVYDVAQLCVTTLKETYKNRIVNITGNEKNKVKEILNIIKSIMNNKIRINYIKDKKIESHYKITPYSIQKDTVKKITANPFINIEQGIYELIKSKGKFDEK
jgi:UDP-glucose 4-epimerase